MGATDSTYADIFSIINPLGFFVSPVFGFIADKYGLWLTQFLMTIIAIIWMSIILSQNLKAQIFNFILYALLKTGVNTIVYGSVREFYGSDHLGFFGGFMTCISGFFSLSYPYIVEMVLTKLDGNFMWPNLFIIFLLVISFSGIYQHYSYHQFKLKYLKELELEQENSTKNIEE